MAFSNLELLAELAKKPNPNKIRKTERLTIGKTFPKYIDEVEVVMGVILSISAQRGKWQPIALGDLFAFCREWRINPLDVNIGLSIMEEAEDIFIRNLFDLGASVIPSPHLVGQLNTLVQLRRVEFVEKTQTYAS